MGLTRPRAYQIFDIDYKQSVRVISLSNVTLSGGAPTVVDGVTLSSGDRVLVAGQNTGSQNGLYQVSILGTGSNGTWIRSVDGNQTGEIDAGMIVMVTEGNVYKDTQWKLTTNDPIVIGTTALTFEQNSAFAFGNIYANGTAVLADIVGDTVTFTPSNNIVITANATSDTITFEVSQSPSFTGTLETNNFSITGNVTGNLLPSANITYNLGSPTQRWNEIFLAGNTIDIGGATISADLTTGSLILTGPDGAEFILTGSDADNALGAFGFLSAGNTEAATSTTTGAITSAGGVGVAGNIYAGGLINAIGNVTGGNLTTSGLLSVTGQGQFTGGVKTNSITSASATITLYDNNQTTLSIGGVSTLANVKGSLNVVANANVGNIGSAGQITATGNVTGGNLVTNGQVVATGNITGGNLSATNISGTLTTASQTNITSVGTLTSLNVTGNVDGGNISGTRGAFTTVAGTLETAAQPNVTSVGTLTSLDVSGNAIIGGDLTVNGNTIYINITDLNVQDPIIGLGRGENNAPLTSDDGKDRGEQLWYYTSAEKSAFIGYDNSADKLIAALDVSVSNEIVTVNSYGNLVIGGLEASTGSFTGNVDTGNISGTTGTFTTIAGTLSTAAQPNVTSVGTLTSLSVTGNVTGGNLVTAGLVNSTGNVTGGNLVTAGQVVATGNIHGSTIKSTANIEIQSRGIMYFYDSDNSNYTALRPQASLTGNYIFILPGNYGNADQVLSTNGAGGLSWVDQSGGGGGGSATSYPNSTVSPVPGSTGNFDLSYDFVQTSQETPFETSATDAFGVNLGEVYSMMDPGGEVLDPVDLGVLT